MIGVCLFGCAYYGSWVKICNDMDIATADCRYVPWAWTSHDTWTSEENYFTRGGVHAVAYAVIYAFTLVVSIFGIVFLMWHEHSCAGMLQKIYAGVLIVMWLIITIMDYVTLGEAASFHTNGTDQVMIDKTIKGTSLRNFFVLLQMFLWFLQTYLFVNAAWDAWDREDEYEMDSRHHEKEITKLKTQINEAVNKADQAGEKAAPPSTDAEAGAKI